MKKILTLLLVLVAATGTITGTNTGVYYLSLSQNDTLRISPNALNWYLNVPVIAEFENGVSDHWRLEMTYPNELTWEGTYSTNGVSGPYYGINIPYIQSDGSEAIYNAVINTIQQETAIGTYAKQTVLESSTTVFGYWDPDNNGSYDPYGLVKWGPGNYDRFFDIRFSFDTDCTGDSIVLNGLMTCTNDWRYPTSLISNTQFHRVIYLVVAYLLGDVNGDELVNMNDVTALIDYLNGTIDLNQYQLAAADINGDGNVTIADVSVLIDMLFEAGTNEIVDFEDM